MSQDADQGRGQFSLEVTARSRRAVDLCRQHLDPGTQVYITFIPGDSHHAIVSTACQLSAAGLVPVPHIAARSLVSFTQLKDYLTRLSGEAGVVRVLLIGGDTERPAGPYASSLTLLESELVPASGITHVGLACYPEPHPKLSAATLDQALRAKLALAAEQGLETWLVSQFCFTADPIVAYLRALRARGVVAPLRIGLAGPGDRRTLLKYGLRCGIGNSIRALGSRVDAVRNLLAQQSPDQIMAGLAPVMAREPELCIEGLHLFPFGNIAASAAWARERTATVLSEV